MNPGFALAFKKTENLTADDKSELLGRAFQVNLTSGWCRAGPVL